MNHPEPHQILAQTLSGLPCAPAQENGALGTLIALLLGDADDAGADGRIARFDAGRLDKLERAARRESEDCLDRLHCLLAVMDGSVTIGNAPLSRESLQQISHHLLRALADHRRWQALAANAAYYRDHRDVAERVVQHLKRME